MQRLSILLAVLLVAHCCGARRLPLALLDHHKPEPKPTPPAPVNDKVSAGAEARATGTDSASAGAGGFADGATKATLADGQAQASGTEAATSVDAFGNSLTSSGRVSSRGKTAGAEGASILSRGQVITSPNQATATGFTSGSFQGAGFFEGRTDTKAVSPFGTATSSSQIGVTSELGGYGSASATSISGPGGLTSTATTVGGNAEGNYGRTDSLAFTVGGYGGKETTTATALTTVSPTDAKSDGTATASGRYGNAKVVVIDTARPDGAIIVGA